MPKRQHGNDNSKQQTTHHTHLICHRPHLYACCTNPTRRKEKGLCDQMSCYRGHSIGGWTRILPKERLDEGGVWVVIPGCPLGREKEAFGAYLNSLSPEGRIGEGVCDQMNRGHSIGGWGKRILRRLAWVSQPGWCLGKEKATLGAFLDFLFREVKRAELWGSRAK